MTSASPELLTLGSNRGLQEKRTALILLLHGSQPFGSIVMTAHFTPVSSCCLQTPLSPSFLNRSSNKTVISFTTILTPLWYGKTVESTPQKDFLTIRAIQQWGSVRFEWSLFLCRLYLKKLGRGEGAITNVTGICFCFSSTHAISFGSSIMIHWGAWSKSFEYRLARTVSKVPSSPLATGRSTAFAELTRSSLPNWSHEWFSATGCHRSSWKSRV